MEQTSRLQKSVNVNMRLKMDQIMPKFAKRLHFSKELKNEKRGGGFNAVRLQEAQKFPEMPKFATKKTFTFTFII